MPRLAPAGAAAMVALSISPLACASFHRGEEARGAEISVSVTCGASAVTVGLTNTMDGSDAGRVRVSRGEDIQWDADGDISDVGVAPKDPSKPLPITGLTTISRGSRKAKKGHVDNKAIPGTYKYKITAVCTDPNTGRTTHVTIDPDMMIS